MKTLKTPGFGAEAKGVRGTEPQGADEQLKGAEGLLGFLGQLRALFGGVLGFSGLLRVPRALGV